MKNTRKIRKISNGYIVSDGNNEIYYNNLKDAAMMVTYCLETNVVTDKEYIFEYSVKYSPDENGPCQKEDNK